MLAALKTFHPEDWSAANARGHELSAQSLSRMIRQVVKVYTTRIEHGGPRGYLCVDLLSSWRRLGLAPQPAHVVQTGSTDTTRPDEPDQPAEPVLEGTESAAEPDVSVQTSCVGSGSDRRQTVPDTERSSDASRIEGLFGMNGMCPDHPDIRLGRYAAVYASPTSTTGKLRANRVIDEGGRYKLGLSRSSVPHGPHTKSAAIIPSPRPTRYALRSQAMSPCRGSDPGSARKPRRRREPAPAEPAAATARCRAAPDPLRLVRLPTARSRPGLRLYCRQALPVPRSSSGLHQNTCRRNAPEQQLSLAEQMVDGGAHQRDDLVAIPTSSPLPRHVDLDDRSIGQVVSPAQEHLADLGQRCCPRSRCAAVGWCASAVPSVSFVTATARSSLDGSAIRRAASISRTAESSGLSTPSDIAK